jgi:NADPH2:quinone reductase
MSRAIVVGRFGGPEVLTLETRDPGPPGPGAVRVRVAAAGVNFIDVYHRTGLYPRPLPFVAGQEGAGVIEAVGAGGGRFESGTHVAWASIPGSYADVVVGPEDNLVAIPTGIADETAAAGILQGMTAHYLAHATRETRPGDVALVHAAAGGVGLLLIQMLKRAGARVVGTCSTEAKAALARQAGADLVVRYTDQDFTQAVRGFTDGAGADVVYDSVGQATFDGSLRALRPRGLLVAFGQSSGPVPPFDPLRLSQLGSLFLTRPTLAHYTRNRGELDARATAVFDGIAAGWLEVRIGATFPLAQAGDAHRALEGRRTAGKVILTFD